jgi:hypothetical protein
MVINDISMYSVLKLLNDVVFSCQWGIWYGIIFNQYNCLIIIPTQLMTIQRCSNGETPSFFGSIKKGKWFVISVWPILQRTSFTESLSNFSGSTPVYGAWNSSIS